VIVIALLIRAPLLPRIDAGGHRIELHATCIAPRESGLGAVGMKGHSRRILPPKSQPMLCMELTLSWNSWKTTTVAADAPMLAPW
jgi:hypothetical protein